MIAATPPLSVPFETIVGGIVTQTSALSTGRRVVEKRVLHACMVPLAWGLMMLADGIPVLATTHAHLVVEPFVAHVSHKKRAL